MAKEKEVLRKPEPAAQAPAKAPPPAAAPKAQPADAGGQPGQAKSELIFLRLGQIVLRPDLYCHRPAEELTEDRLASLMESIRTEKGIQVPVEVAYGPDGLPVLTRGYRRISAARLLADQRVAGFSLDMPVPAVVVRGLSDQDLLVRSVLDNENRKSHGPVDRLVVARRFYEAGIQSARAASALGVAEKTYQRDLRVARQPWLVDLVKADKVAPSTAATLLEAVEKEGREAEFQEDLEAWVGRTEQRVQALERLRKAEGKGLTAAERQVKNYLTRELLGRWLADLRQGRPFEEKAEWTLPVSLEPDKGVLQVERTRIDLNAAEVEDLAKAAAKFSHLAKEMVRYIELRSLLGQAAGGSGDPAGLDLEFLRASGLTEVADRIAGEFAAGAGGAAAEPEAAEDGGGGAEEAQAAEGE
jgi:hypothetical protein